MVMLPSNLSADAAPAADAGYLWAGTFSFKGGAGA